MKKTDIAKEIIESLYVGRHDHDMDYVGVRIPESTGNDIELNSVAGVIWLMEMLEKLTPERSICRCKDITPERSDNAK